MDSDNRRDEVLAVATLFLVLSWTTVSLRFYVRGIYKKTWGKDDSFMGATLVGFKIFFQHLFGVWIDCCSFFSRCILPSKSLLLYSAQGVTDGI